MLARLRERGLRPVALADRVPVEVDRDNFDAVLARFAVDVSSPVGGGNAVPIRIAARLTLPSSSSASSATRRLRSSDFKFIW